MYVKFSYNFFVRISSEISNAYIAMAKIVIAKINLVILVISKALSIQCYDVNITITSVSSFHYVSKVSI